MIIPSKVAFDTYTINIIYFNTVGDCLFFEKWMANYEL